MNSENQIVITPESVTDPELRAKLEAVMREHNKPLQTLPPEVNKRPRFVFSRSTNSRVKDSFVKIRNGLDEESRGGTILEQVGRAYRVLCEDQVIIVHEPDDSWE